MNEVKTLLLPEMRDIWQQTLNWQPDTEQEQKFQRLYELILSGNSQLNLTRITEPEEFWEKHLWDSLRGVKPLLATHKVKQRIIDIGTGAGFPGIPAAIAFPNSSFSLLDSTRKKITFIETLLPQLKIGNAKTLVGRSEEIGQQIQYRQSYDTALVRAVAPASVCAEYTLPLLKLGGLAILYRGQWTDAETEALNPAVTQLGGVIELIEEFNTPLSQSHRNCLYLRKVAATPAEFPRAVGIPTQKPL